MHIWYVTCQTNFNSRYVMVKEFKMSKFKINIMHDMHILRFISDNRKNHINLSIIAHKFKR